MADNTSTKSTGDTPATPSTSGSERSNMSTKTSGPGGTRITPGGTLSGNPGTEHPEGRSNLERTTAVPSDAPNVPVAVPDNGQQAEGAAQTQGLPAETVRARAAAKAQQAGKPKGANDSER
jgi:hypothetical protein